MKYGFIGLGNMAKAIKSGMLNSGAFESKNIYGYDVSENAREAEKENCVVVDSISQVIESSDIIILAIKPQVIESVLNELKGKKLKVISIVAGKTTAYIQGILGSDSEVVRVMPNINAFVGAATSAYVPTENASNELCNETVKIFNTIGSIVRLQEKQFSAFTAICGSAPAFTYMYIDALAKAAVKGGLPRDVAQNLAADMVKGSAKMVLESKVHPIELADRVCSPEGTTINGVLSLQQNGFEAAVADAVQAVIDRDRELGK